MFKKFRFKRKVAKRLASVGSTIDISYLIYINNEEPISFPTKDDCINYLRSYRDNNVISRIQIFRIETYSL